MAGRALRIILNSGKAPGRPLERAVETVRRHGHTVEIQMTNQETGAAKLARQAVEDGINVVVAAGGDGTVNEVVNGLFAASAEPDVTMAVLPLGTANDFARSCSVPLRNPIEALSLAATAEPTAIDVGCMNQHYFLNAVIAGFGADATFRTSEPMKRWLGCAAYKVAGMLGSFRSAAYTVQIRTSEGVEEAPVSFVAVMNGQWAGGARLAKKAKLNDGKLDLLTVPACPMANLPTLLTDFRAMAYRDPKFIQYKQHKWIEIESQGELPVSPDGEQFHGSGLKISILKQRLPFALPSTAYV